MDTYSLFQLNQYVKRVIALNFQDAVWIKAEISQVKMSRGSYYLDLIEKNENSEEIKAKASAIIWFKTVSFLRKKFNTVVDSILDTGNEVRIKIRVQFDERYGYSLVIEDLDAGYTLGKNELLKQDILNRLRSENLLNRNAQLSLPVVLQNIAVISSETAAGYKDFLNHLEENSYHYKYNLHLYHTAVQGKAAESEIVEALDKINTSKTPYHCIVIIRGGGSRLDLAAFDSYNIAAKIAQSKYPVITGIGHDIDQSIADIVSHTALKTPTAVADYLIEYNLAFESKVLDLANKIQLAYRDLMKNQSIHLSLLLEKIKNAGLNKIQYQQQYLNELDVSIRNTTNNQISKQIALMDQLETQIRILSPENILQRGFSLVRINGKVVQFAKEIKLNDLMDTEFVDGSISSVVTKNSHNE